MAPVPWNSLPSGDSYAPSLRTNCNSAHRTSSCTNATPPPGGFHTADKSNASPDTRHPSGANARTRIHTSSGSVENPIWKPRQSGIFQYGSGGDNRRAPHGPNASASKGHNPGVIPSMLNRTYSCRWIEAVIMAGYREGGRL